MTALPPPNQSPRYDPNTPALWAPRTRTVVTRFGNWMDRRKARDIGRHWLEQQDLAWKQQYTDWWMTSGWQQGADNPDVAYRKLRSTRP